MTTWMPVGIEPRAVRGLLRRLPDALSSGRRLVHYAIPYNESPTYGICQWCERPTETKRRTWHTDCLRVYFMAKGQTVYSGGGRVPLYTTDRKHFKRIRHVFLWKRQNPDTDPLMCPDIERCVQCVDRQGIEIDHIVALSVAREARRLGCRKWWVAWLPMNLRPLCHECHCEKTRADRSLLRKLERIKGESNE